MGTYLGRSEYLGGDLLLLDRVAMQGDRGRSHYRHDQYGKPTRLGGDHGRP